MDRPQSSITQLQKRLGIELKAINTARALSDKMREDLAARLRSLDSSDASVVYGSLAREEFTEGSDVDWTLLIDGFADPKHLEVEREIDKIISKAVAKPPGREGTFGTLTFSHELVHQIGGKRTRIVTARAAFFFCWNRRPWGGARPMNVS